MKRIASLLLMVVVFVVATAHVGSPNMIYDGAAGPYAVRVVVRPPDVVPGLADVVVRVVGSDITRVTVQPVFWRAGVKGAPKGDEMKRAPGASGAFNSQVWLMSRGSYSVYVTVEGARGTGTAIVPVNAFATGRLPLSSGLRAVLIVLGVLLVAGLLTIIRAAVGESLLPPGEPFTTTQRRRANITTLIAIPILAVLIFGGATWWNSVDDEYQRTMFHPPAVDATIDTDATHRTLHLVVHDTAAFHAIIASVAPDHGKMMHLFLVSTSNKQTLAHLHPIETPSLHFRTELPWLPAGRYLLFGDIVLENGTSLTVSNTLDIPPAPGKVTPSDPDDSWDRTASITPLVPNAVRILTPGYTMTSSVGDAPIVAGQTVDLRFTVKDSSGKVVALQPYLGMAGHAIVIKHDASVFIHLHPMGTVAQASQDAFMLRDRGDTTARGRLRTAALESTQMAGMPAMAFSGELSIPYEFPKPGRYRIWVQVKPKDTVLTGAFDVDVR